MSSPAASFQNVSKIYKSGLLGRQQLTALRGVSLRIERGTVLGLIGPNRAGKTTLIKLLLSLARPTSGEIQRLGQPLSERKTLAQVGYVHENHAFPRYLSAAHLLELYGALSLVPYETVLNRVPELLEKVGLADRAHEPISRFSKGMVQRLGVAQALINDPELLVLDEPTEGLDLTGRQLLREIAQDFKKKNRTVILVSHVLTEIEELCDRIALLTEGQLKFSGTISELKQEQSKDQSATLEQALQEMYS